MSEPFLETGAPSGLVRKRLAGVVGAVFVALSAFWVLLDGENPGLSHGVDIDEDGSGRAPRRRHLRLVHDVATGASPLEATWEAHDHVHVPVQPRCPSYWSGTRGVHRFPDCER
jgi:hypothetical protein